MAYSFKLSGGTADELQVARVRDEIDDVSASAAEDGGVVGTDYFLTDERILRRLADVENKASTDVNKSLLAAASALDTLATNQAYVLKKKQTLGEDIDGAAVSKEIRAHATTLRRRVAQSEVEAAEVIAATQATLGVVLIERAGEVERSEYCSPYVTTPFD